MNLLQPLQRVPRRMATFGMLAALALTVLVPATALAAPRTTTPCDLTCVKAFGDARVQERLTALNTFSGKVNTRLAAKHISTDQANVLLGDATTNTNGLTALKAKLDGETDTTAARHDVENIYVVYRIYAVVLPRDYHHLALDIMQTVDNALEAAKPKIETAIDAAPVSEKAQLNTLYSDYKAKLAEGESQIDAALGQIATLTPQTYDTARTTYTTAFTDYRNDEHVAHTNIVAAGSDLHKIVQILKSSSATTTGTATATP